MKFTQLEIPDVYLIEPQVFGDARGWFLESFSEKIFAQNGITERFVQDNQSRSAKGVLRGLHYQIPPKAQSKLVRVIRGSILDVAVDIRKSSKTFGKHVAVRLDSASHQMLFVPRGFAHGFCALEEGTEVLYKVTDFYAPDHERGILWNDPKLAIQWPQLDVDYIFSEKDQKYPAFENAIYFD